MFTNLLSAGISTSLTNREMGRISVKPTKMPRFRALLLSSSVASSSLALSLASPAPNAPVSNAPVPIAAPATGSLAAAAIGAAIPAIDPNACPRP